ncbi:MAG TPA: hypothetical protein ENO18_01160, partial [Caldithrix sp.]|nr:hypothetical protein [Caldithrix sp.]
MKIDMQTLKAAYKKLKSYVYEDNTLLHLRIALAKFESSGDVESKLDAIIAYLELNNIDDYLEKVDLLVLPKKIADRHEHIDNSPILYTNE